MNWSPKIDDNCQLDIIEEAHKMSLKQEQNQKIALQDSQNSSQKLTKVNQDTQNDNMQNNVIEAEFEEVEIFNREVCEARVIQSRNIAEMSFVEMGKNLAMLKQNLPHGEFGKSLVKVGVSHRMANRFIRMNDKLSDLNSTPVANLGIRKSYALTTLEEFELEELSSGGEIAGKSLADLSTMNVKQVEEFVRGLKKQKESLEKEMSEQEKIHKMALDTRDKNLESLRGDVERLTKENLNLRNPDTNENDYIKNTTRDLHKLMMLTNDLRDSIKQFIKFLNYIDSYVSYESKLMISERFLGVLLNIEDELGKARNFAFDVEGEWIKSHDEICLRVFGNPDLLSENEEHDVDE